MPQPHPWPSYPLTRNEAQYTNRFFPMGLLALLRTHHRIKGPANTGSLGFLPSSLLRRRQTKSNVIARVVAAADGHDDVLLAINSVGHGRTALRGWHPDRPDLLTGLFV